MKKRLLTIGLCVAVGVVMLFTAAFVSANGNSGYDELKAAMKNMSKVENFTGNIQMNLKDNGNTLVGVVGGMKVKHDGKTGSCSGIVTITSDGQEKTISLYGQNERMVIKVNGSDVYNVIDAMPDSKHMGNMRGMGEHDRASAEMGEKLMDFMAGDFKNQIVAETRADGAKQFSMELSQNEIPEIANIMASLAVSNRQEENFSSRMHKDPLGLGIDLSPELPKLVEDIRISGAGFEMLVDKNNVLGSMTINVSMAGKDENGKLHEITLSLDFAASDINCTTPDTVDLTGKQVKNINLQEYDCEYRD